VEQLDRTGLHAEVCTFETRLRKTSWPPFSFFRVTVDPEADCVLKSGSFTSESGRWSAG
jgi:hypothetical protein